MQKNYITQLQKPQKQSSKVGKIQSSNLFCIMLGNHFKVLISEMYSHNRGPWGDMMKTSVG